MIHNTVVALAIHCLLVGSVDARPRPYPHSTYNLLGVDNTPTGIKDWFAILEHLWKPQSDNSPVFKTTPMKPDIKSSPGMDKTLPSLAPPFPNNHTHGNNVSDVNQDDKQKRHISRVHNLHPTPDIRSWNTTNDWAQLLNSIQLARSRSRGLEVTL